MRRAADCSSGVRYFLFKPDGIGDFVLVTGSISLLAREAGEENLTICVRDLLAPLAGAQFPRATVIGLPVVEKRRVVNLFLANFLRCLPARRALRARPVESAACYRHMRAYLQTFLFFSARSRRFVACENLLARNRKPSRVFVEALVQRLYHPEIVPYPDSSDSAPTELEANRRVTERLLGRAVALAEVLPVLRTSATVAPGRWVLCPLSSKETKDYPLAAWREVFQRLGAEERGREIVIAGSHGQRVPLEELAGLLRGCGFVRARAEVPGDLLQFVELLGTAEGILTVDTAAAHIATALDKPCVVLFSGLHRGMFGPWTRSERQRWLAPPAPGRKQKWHAALPPENVAGQIREALRAAKL